MVRLYLDIETHRHDEEAFVDEKIIAISVLEDRTPHGVQYKSFTEWVLGSEQKVVRAFYEYLFEFQKEIEMRKLEIVGYNILRFDIPLLLQKGFEYGIDKLDKLNKLLNHDIRVIDLFQVTLPLSQMVFSRHGLKDLVSKAKKCCLEIPEPYGSGKDVKEWYRNRMYNEIEEHLKSDLEIVRAIHLQLYKLMKCYYEGLQCL